MADALTTALSQVTSIFTSVGTMVTGNAVAMTFIAFALTGCGVGLFKKVARFR